MAMSKKFAGVTLSCAILPPFGLPFPVFFLGHAFPLPWRLAPIGRRRFGLLLVVVPALLVEPNLEGLHEPRSDDVGLSALGRVALRATDDLLGISAVLDRDLEFVPGWLARIGPFPFRVGTPQT